MEMRSFGRLGRVSALTLGGGRIGNFWGEVEREECRIRGWGLTGVGHLDVQRDGEKLLCCPSH